ncbi:hypothetical protein QCA50_011066 [Cerrena zonata]|uniref:Carboxypeptidase n=1 Tax=Cerrena zonata TaxID=2478898 RepID=A0AAW0FY25_9APHY
MFPRSTFLIVSAAIALVRCQGINDPQPVNPSWPHDYPGKPDGDFSPDWQEYFRVKDPLPDITFPVARSFAGNVGVNRQGHPNNTLFFWAFEKENGTLTNPENIAAPWGIWLNGGPGSSSMLGLLFENGPIHINGDYSVSGNQFSWNTLADYFWLDQPVGTGWSTVEADGLARDEDELGRDFWGFVENIVKVFPNLKSRPLYLTGESYAGVYIPYITKTYFGLDNPPVRLAKIAIGDGSLGSDRTNTHLPTLSVIRTYPQLISYDPEVYAYFKEQSDLCGYNITLTYPQNGHFPTLDGPISDLFSSLSLRLKATARRVIFSKREMASEVQKRALEHPGGLQKREASRQQWKRDLSDRANGTIDPYYQCAIYDEMVDYALNFSLPWNLSDHTNGPDYNAFDVYNIPDALDPESPLDAAPFLNNDQTRAAIHAPTVKNWVPTVRTPFGTNDGTDPSVESAAFLSELATNASAHGIPVVIYSGNDDSLVPHFGNEVVIQNTTFGGIQGFTRKPQTPWLDDDGNFAGIAHQERNWTFVLFSNASHQVPMSQPGRALIFLRDFILGSTKTGLVQKAVDGAVDVIGGEEPALFIHNILEGQDGIFVGSSVTQSTINYPAATVAAWNAFIATATATPITTIPTAIIPQI